jgi:hypothetical protein
MSYEEELELLKSQLRAEKEERPPLRLEEIHPAMTEVDKTRAMAEIVRVLRGEQ